MSRLMARTVGFELDGRVQSMRHLIAALDTQLEDGSMGEVLGSKG